MSLITTWKQWAKTLKTNTFALYLACRDPRTPWYAKVFAGCVVAYAFSPIDLIPDFVPILGYVDDLILVPLGLAIALKLIPAEVFADCKAEAEAKMSGGKPINRVAAVVIVLIWILLALGAITLIVHTFK